MELFLTGDALRTMMIYLCNSSLGSVVDPVTNTLFLMLSSPVSVVLSQVGVAPFKSHGNMVFPYRFMNDDQKAFLREFVLDTKPLVSGLMVATQIGGGCILGANSNKKLVHIPPISVFAAFCDAVKGSTVHKDTVVQRGICNIIIQRVCGIYHLDRSTLNAIGKYLPILEAPEVV